jgi:hypothetical protein
VIATHIRSAAHEDEKTIKTESRANWQKTNKKENFNQQMASNKLQMANGKQKEKSGTEL